LDQRLGIEPGQVTPGLAKLLVLAGVEVAFEEAGRWMEQFLLFRVSDSTIRKETERFGQLQAQREADRYEQLVFVCDGAQWIWKLVERYFPEAVQIVDWYHASQYLTPIAEAAWGEKDPDRQAWLEQARSSLWEGHIADLVQDCRVVGQEHPQAQESRPASHQLLLP
jgi:hypothetical protein